MQSNEEENRPFRGKQRPQGLQEKVAQLYYSHGLFCSTYPITVITIAISIILLSCYPLVNLPFSGNCSIQVFKSFNESSSSSVNGRSESAWFYVQQIIIRSAVIPWHKDLLHLGDAFRAPLYEAFKLVEVVRNYEEPGGGKTLGHVCLHVEALKKTKDERNNVFPEYNCLVLSPTNLWHQDAQQFVQDNSILTTIFDHQDLQKGKISIAELLFGMHMSNTGIKRYPLRNRQRILQYAITLFYKDYNEDFVLGLKNKLQKLYRLNGENVSNNNNFSEEVAYISYPDDWDYSEFVPLTMVFILLFVYYYFSVRKIELIKSKCGMALTAVLTVLGSLTATLGICFFFGLTLSTRAKEIFPYLVTLVGLENVLVLTKSVTSAPLHLDVKIRVAQGLSKEGWSITKTLLIEVTILTVGLFTFVPAIQELCIFAIVGLAIDFVLQMLLFSTVLSVDMTRRENLVEKGTSGFFRNALYQTRHYHHHENNIVTTGMSRSKSHPKLTTYNINGVCEKKIPKRVKLVNIWVRTRFFQRAFMFLMVVWIGRILYDTGIIEHYFIEKNKDVENGKSQLATVTRTTINNKNRNGWTSNNFVLTQQPDVVKQQQNNNTEELKKLKHPDFSTSLRHSAQYWPTILKKYNVSLSGRSVVVLPSIKLSHAVDPDRAILLRNPNEVYGHKFHWQALAAALDPIDFTDSERGTPSPLRENEPFYPNSPMGIFLTTILCLISSVVMSYAFFVLYRCICSRNYAEWRASWFTNNNDDDSNNGYENNNRDYKNRDVPPVLLEAAPVVLRGHAQEIECLATDGLTAASSCLGGQLKVWDINTGDLITAIDRRSSYRGGGNNDAISPEASVVDDNLSDYESGSPASHEDPATIFPSLRHKINVNFSGLRAREEADVTNNSLYDYGEDYRELYEEFRSKMKNDVNDTERWVRRQNGERCFDLDEIDLFYCYNHKNQPSASVWCIDYVDNLIAAGCADGSVEFWEGTTGKFKCKYTENSSSSVSVTSVKIIGSRVIVVRLSGTVDFLQLQTFNHGRPVEWNFTSAYRRTHNRAASAGSLSDLKNATSASSATSASDSSTEEMVCLKFITIKAHQQPVNCLDSEGGRVLTGSQDHTLKVFRLDNGARLYTLHGHYGPITSLFIDRVSPASSGSGSQDGTVCLWDLTTGACIYSNKAHDGAVTSLAYSASYVISMGADERLCVWERFQGHLLNAINLTGASNDIGCCSMLTSRLVVTTRRGGLVVWDVRSGDRVATLMFDSNARALVYVKQIVMLRDALLCDYGNEMRIVRFPISTHKND